MEIEKIDKKPVFDSSNSQNKNFNKSKEGINNNDNLKNRKKKKVCIICTEKNFKLDFKESLKFKRFISERAKILPRRVTGMCSKHQRVLTLAVKRARFLALLPYCLD